ncbi:MAG TPA: AAA family ATPase [Candidatus Polarisedimenticolaceae bacterium]|nr:AAA family ATPase [Candidatus Polarisedimenticolaceae bacterium]
MGTDDDRGPKRRIESLDQQSLELRLRQAAHALWPERVFDDLEVRHLVRVVTDGSLLLTDVYSENRISRIMQGERGTLGGLVDRWVESERQGDGEALVRIRSLPDAVRLVGDKALFDLGLSGMKQVRGYDLEDLGTRAYLVAAQILELLAEDRRLREFFKQNRLLMLPLEEELVFLRQCSDNFRVHAGILRHTHDSDPHPACVPVLELARQVPLMAAAADALGHVDAYVAAATAPSELGTSREQTLSAYERMLLFSALDLGRLEAALEATVVDQPRAVHTLCDEFSLFAAGTRDPRKPPAFFLVGPTGVGKNHLVESLGRALEGLWRIEVPLLTIEGPSYTYPSDINELRGATRGFIRSDEEGLLGAFHEKSSRAPLAVILIDEVEKAHPQLLTFFLSILDRGTTTDNRGRVLNFSNCILFFTSNLGYSDSQVRSAPIGYGDEEARAAAVDNDVRRELRRALKPEFVNRVKLVHFERLTPASMERILDLELARIARRYREIHDLELEVDRAARAELVARGFSPVFGARHLAATLETVCNVEIAKRIRGDAGGDPPEHEDVVAWLREMRAGRRAFDADELRRRVIALTRARLGYRRLRIGYEDGQFVYAPVAEER